ncbi:MAG: signal peptide peptidase SppA [Prolixibacteraceae bacterium]|jgi:protease-4|nr:signal peptide peptidase SppA [Prolixibacteraceae bacterium]
MKDFFKYVLATVVGFIIVMVVGSFLTIGVISVIVAAAGPKEVVLKDNSMLRLDLDGQIVDRAANDPFANLNLPGMQGTNKIGLSDIISAIDKAADDDRIKGIYLRIDQVMGSFAVCEEIRNALKDFKEESGKFVYAYSENYSQNAYYLSSVADKVFINTEGMLSFSGLASYHSFYKNALEKLGVEMQIIRHGKFKAAVEPFMLEEMSPENRKQIEVYIGSIWNTVLEDIANSRNVSVEELNKIADQNISFEPTYKLKALNLVDSVLYTDQVGDFLRSSCGLGENDDLRFHSISDMKNVVATKIHKGLARDKIAVVYAAGEIVMQGGSPFDQEMIVGGSLAAEISKARKDSSIKAIVLRVNSPGGSALASDLIWREVKLASETKPVVVSMGGLAASGGYYIACAADTIVANPSTLTGSIGVFGMIPNTQELFEDKLGINNEVVKTNDLSDLPSITRPLTKLERDKMQQMVENVYSTFVQHVADGRGMSFEEVDAIGQGRVWTGANAKEIGLVDVLGDLGDAIDIAKEMSGVEAYRIVEYPTKKDPIQIFLENFTSKLKHKVISNEFGAASKHYYALKSIMNRNGVMARLPYDVSAQ